jgi:hypothetical protein
VKLNPTNKIYNDEDAARALLEEQALARRSGLSSLRFIQLDAA